MSEPKRIEHLVLSAGGTKGFTYVGFLKALEECNQLANIKRVIGSSTGAIFALCIALKYTSVKLEPIWAEFSMSSILDINVHTLLSSLNTFGLDSGVKFIEFIKQLIRCAGYDENITLRSAFEATGIHFICNSVRVNDFTCHYFDYKSYPDLPLWQVIRMTTCLPMIYPPVIFEGSYWIDGGVINGFPVHYMEEYLETSLGVKFDYDVNQNTKIDTFVSYAMAIIKCMQAPQQQNLDNLEDKILKLKPGTLNFFDMEMKAECVRAMVNIGYEQSLEFLHSKGYSNK